MEPVPLSLAWAAARQAVAWLDGGLADLYPHPADLAALDAAIAARRRAWQAPREALVAALAETLEPAVRTAAQDEALALLARPDGLAVVAGQQPGACGGPLYTLLKAVGAVALAARLREAGLPAVAVFWAAGEDDDFAEVRGLDLLDRDGVPRRLLLDADGADGDSVGLRRLTVDPRRQLADWLPDTAFSPWALAAADGYAPGATLDEAFARWLLHLLGAHGLLLINPLRPAIRALSAPVVDRAMADPLTPGRLAGEVGRRLKSLGYPVPMHRQADLCPFFRYVGRRRGRVRFDGREFSTDDGTRLAPAALRDELATDPGRFSSSLLLRPLVQDYLLPTAAFAVGPGEAAYLAQVAPAYQAYGVTPSLWLPRFSATVIDDKSARRLTDYHLTMADCWQPLEPLALAVSRARHGQETAALFATVTEQIDGEVTRLLAHATDIDASLLLSGETRRNRIRFELSRLEGKVQRALQRRDETIDRRLRRVQAAAAPGGKLQERALGAMHLLAAHGPDVIARLLAVAGEPRIHAVVRLAP